MLALCSCVKSGEPKIDYIPFQDEKNGEWGFINAKGEVLYIEEFKSKPSYVIDGCFYVKEKDETYSIYKATEKTPTVLVEGLKDVGLAGDGLIPTVRKNGRIIVVDTNGEEKFSLDPQNGWEITSCGLRFVDGINWILAKKGSEIKYGLINNKGEVTVEPQYDEIVLLSGAKALAVKEIEANNSQNKEYDVVAKYTIINDKGEEIANFTYKGSAGFDWPNGLFEYRYGDYIAVSDGDRYHIIKISDGSEVYKCKTDEKVRSISSGFYVFKEGESKYGVKTVEGEEIFKGGFDRITIVNKDLFFARRDGEKGYWYNAKGERIGTEDDVTAFAASCDYVVMEKDDEYLLVNEKGEKVSNEYAYIERITDVNNSGAIFSDYFSAKEFLAEKIGPLTNAGFNVNIGETAANCVKAIPELENEGNYSYSFEKDEVLYNFNNPIKEGCYTTKTVEGFWGPETVRVLDGYKLSDAKLISISFNFAANTNERTEEVYKILDKALSVKGYKLVKTDGENVKTFESDKCKIYVSYKYGEIYFIIEGK